MVPIPPQPVAPLAEASSAPSLADAVLARARGIIDIEIQALDDLKRQLDAGLLKALEILESCDGRVVVTGMGKSGLIGRKIAATLSSTGTPALYLHPAEGSHGDFGAVMQGDVVIAISNSGETPELLNILPLVKRFGLPLIALAGQPESTLARQADVFLNIAVRQEACPLGLAPTASTTATLALGDTLAVLLLERKGFTREDFALFHPAGALGKQLLLTVGDLMHTGNDLPVVGENTPFLDALLVISSKKLGATLVADEAGRVTGILTDGDVRRALTRFEDARSIPLAGVFTRSPRTARQDELAVTALRRMEECKITVLPVLNPDGTPLGLLHLHDILKTGIS